MDDKRQNNQLGLAFMEEDRGEAPRAFERDRIVCGKARDRKPSYGRTVDGGSLRAGKLQAGIETVKANKGSPGVDGMTVHDLPGHLKQHWPAIREQLLNGTYKPQPVRRVEIPKAGGGVRKLGIPTVLDRFIQQAVMQVLQGRWERTFSDPATGLDLGARRITPSMPE